eukprot:g10711.t1
MTADKEARREPGGNNAGFGSEEASGSDDGSVSALDEGPRRVERHRHRGGSGRQRQQQQKAQDDFGRSSGRDEWPEGKKRPACKHHERLLGGRRSDQADPYGVSSEESSKSLEAFAWATTPGVASASRWTRRRVCCRGRWSRTTGRPESGWHSILVTGMGSVYSAGDGTAGALGLCARESSDAFRLVEWFAEQMPPPKACQASAESDLIGCHSAVLDANGRPYT